MNNIALKTPLDGHGLHIGLVQSRFNEPIVNQMVAACLKELAVLGVSPEKVDAASVPGALEIPLLLQSMALTGRYDALIAIGAVIRGETYHFEVVSNESCRGVSEVALHTGVPIANGILTTNTDEQALARVEEKGADCARVAVEMALLIASVTNHSDRVSQAKDAA
ncbi:MAG: 6,7-dimethyl-8-ribityllumazine synthase [Rhodocyclaceae bacterium]|jgi:6,7-dimethyl-8-ribityllumazine synthase|nr:6,7-dimethyl-8-ribityllumazine synthase [Rhodocyclaceae bacterium]MCE2721827.1 6,7-dimethyl-8-ribityllumazine synthase [Betaproteobacteria bacterium]MCA3020849.1 6,7-dimethyl-8-ribityllumazine synthase [Rhodocyclaceae bacterium]MCA3024476.1 6,7-dimethyl-8-ribityllumazine synthase [Rhodocyclaceae bacterium]MCA3028908.1 6,7-dimethyl-8-ribityllumazine synthase [Rhodocyclaceae bacterium]